MVGVNTGERDADPAKKAKEFQTEHSLTYPIWLDKDTSQFRKWGGQAFPTNAIIDKEGKVRYLQPGYDAAALTKLVEALLQ